MRIAIKDISIRAKLLAFFYSDVTKLDNRLIYFTHSAKNWHSYYLEELRSNFPRAKFLPRLT